MLFSIECTRQWDLYLSMSVKKILHSLNSRPFFSTIQDCLSMRSASQSLLNNSDWLADLRTPFEMLSVFSKILHGISERYMRLLLLRIYFLTLREYLHVSQMSLSSECVGTEKHENAIKICKNLPYAKGKL